MKAQILRSYGATPDFALADLPRPELKPGHVLIRVAATSVNPVDIKMRTLAPPFAPKPPAVMGMDVAGVVEAVGEGVSAFKPGDEVFGCPGGIADLPGALAEYMLADARLLARKPVRLSMAQAAALAEAGKLSPVLAEHRFRFEEIAQAQEYLASGKAVGKVVLEIR